MKRNQKKEINNRFDEIITSFRNAKAQPDILPTPKLSITAEPSGLSSQSSSSSLTDELITAAIAHLQMKDRTEAPIITLVNTQTPFSEIRSEDINSEEYLTPMTKETLATLLSVPVSFESQSNSDIYKIYSYSTFEFKPRLDFYFSDKAGLGITYDFNSTTFPFDTVYAGTENALRLDNRIEILSGAVLITEGGLASKHFEHPIQYYVSVTGKPKNSTLVITSANYMHFFLGGGFVFFPAERFSFGLAASLKRSPELRPYLFDSLLTARSQLGGRVNGDEYSYNLTRETIYALWKSFWDINFTFDFSYETRHYANIELQRRNAKLPKLNIQRDDHGPIIGLNLSKEIFFASRLVNIFQSLTPGLNFLSTHYTSTVEQFNYKDFTTMLTFEFGF
jgi:hypothetical protein